MKSLLNIIIAIFFTLFLLGQANAQIFVAKKPQKPKIMVVKSSKPGPGYKWIDGRWKVHNNKYIWAKGYWIKAHKHSVWIPGYWKKAPRGWKWIPGHWKNLKRKI